MELLEPQDDYERKVLSSSIPDNLKKTLIESKRARMVAREKKLQEWSETTLVEYRRIANEILEKNRQLEQEENMRILELFIKGYTQS